MISKTEVFKYLIYFIFCYKYFEDNLHYMCKWRHKVDKSSELPSWRLVTMNTVYLWRYFPNWKYVSVDYKW